MHRIIESSHAPHRSLRNNSNYWYASFVATSPLALSGASSPFFISLSTPFLSSMLAIAQPHSHSLFLSLSLILSFSPSPRQLYIFIKIASVSSFLRVCLAVCPLWKEERDIRWERMQRDSCVSPAHIVGPRLKISTGWAVPFLSLSLSPLSLFLSSR